MKATIKNKATNVLRECFADQIKNVAELLDISEEKAIELWFN